MRQFVAPDGATWNVDVKLPSHSSAMLTFQHTGGQAVASDRYAWINARDTTDPRDRLVPKTILENLDEGQIARLFRRSMAVGRVGG